MNKVNIPSELLNKILPNMCEGISIFIGDLSKEFNNSKLLELLPKFHTVLEIDNDGFDDILLVRIPQLESMLNDKDCFLSEYISTFDTEEKSVLQKLGLC